MDTRIRPRAFSSEVDTGSREENASKQQTRAPFLFNRNGKGSSLQFLGLIASVLLTCSLTGCSSINEKIASGAGDYIPRWAGGLPPDAPPRPGTAKYDEYMKERERNRLLPADQRNSAKPDETKSEPVH
jgi:hypothetical protein